MDHATAPRAARTAYRAQGLLRNDFRKKNSNRRGGGVHLGPLGTIVPTPGDFYDEEIVGMMIGRGNRSTRRKPTPVPLYTPYTPHALPGREPRPPEIS
jgi:hypothetical protein